MINMTVAGVFIACIAIKYIAFRNGKFMPVLTPRPHWLSLFLKGFLPLSGIFS
jgi:hypothetical protein